MEGSSSIKIGENEIQFANLEKGEAELYKC